MEGGNSSRRRESPGPKQSEIPKDPLEFLASTWSISAMEVSRKLFSLKNPESFCYYGDSLQEEGTDKKEDVDANLLAAEYNSCSVSSLLGTDRINEQPLNNVPLHISKPPSGRATTNISQWLKDCREKKKEETRAHKAQIHAAISVAALSAAVSSATTRSLEDSKSRENKEEEEEEEEEEARMDAAIASAAALVAAYCVEAAEAMGAERELLASVVGSAVRARTPGDLVALTAAAATALRGNATMKARALKEVWNFAAVLPLDKGPTSPFGLQERHSLHHAITNDSINQHPFTNELLPEDFLAICSQQFLSQGANLLKRTRKGALHWKNVSFCINSANKVMLKMKSRYVAGTIAKKKKFSITDVVLEMIKDVAAWPGRHLLEGGDHRHYFGLKTLERGVIEFECKTQQDYEMWTKGVARLLHLTATRLSACT